jgi:uncharacterized protein (DUF1501 family)
MNRRTFLQTSTLGLAAMGLPVGASWASSLGSDRKLLFVFAQGGWDPTRAFAPVFDLNDIVDLEPEAALSQAGNIPFVDHPSRPSVRAFFQANADRMLVLNGVMVRSIAHDICTMLAMTGDTSGTFPDWAAIVAASQSERYTLPQLVLGGPSFAGQFGDSVARAGAAGQLEGLLSGDILDRSDLEIPRLSRASSGIVDRYLSRRAGGRVLAATSSIDAQLATAFERSTERAQALKDYRYIMDFTTGPDLTTQANVAVDALSVGLCRCATLGHAGQWDTHADNDELQSALWEGLFGDLGQLMALLDETPGTGGGSLADETVVVVLSEMGRTPLLNGTLGKDHWPFTSMMMLGPGLSTNRVIGGFDAQYMGESISFSDGATHSGGQILTAEAVGASLLTLMDVDPTPFVSGTTAIDGMLT